MAVPAEFVVAIEGSRDRGRGHLLDERRAFGFHRIQVGDGGRGGGQPFIPSDVEVGAPRVPSGRALGLQPGTVGRPEVVLVQAGKTGHAADDLLRAEISVGHMVFIHDRAFVDLMIRGENGVIQILRVGGDLIEGAGGLDEQPAVVGVVRRQNFLDGVGGVGVGNALVHLPQRQAIDRLFWSGNKQVGAGPRINGLALGEIVGVSNDLIQGPCPAMICGQLLKAHLEEGMGNFSQIPPPNVLSHPRVMTAFQL